MYFKSATEAVEYAQIQIERQGYNVNPYEWFTKIACGGKYGRLRPSIGQYHSFIIELSKDGKPSKKCLSITLYGMDSGNFELVNYIN